MGKSSERQSLGGLNVPYSTLIPYFQKKDERMFTEEHQQALWLALRPTPYSGRAPEAILIGNAVKFTEEAEIFVTACQENLENACLHSRDDCQHDAEKTVKSALL